MGVDALLSWPGYMVRSLCFQRKGMSSMRVCVARRHYYIKRVQRDTVRRRTLRGAGLGMRPAAVRNNRRDATDLLSTCWR